jgi:hypothetical protein
MNIDKLVAKVVFQGLRVSLTLTPRRPDRYGFALLLQRNGLPITLKRSEKVSSKRLLGEQRSLLFISFELAFKVLNFVE